MPFPHLLTNGIYTVVEAAHLVGTTRQRVRGWVEGYPRRSLPPIIDNEIGWVNDRVAFSFTNLMEMRFIAFFERAGVRLPYIRSIMTQVRDQIHHPHPFATQLVFRTDGRKIVTDVALRNGIEYIYDLKSKNYEMKPVVLDSLMDDVIYDASGVARMWYPRRNLAPNVVLHPKFAFGHATLRDSHIPTRALAEAVLAEGGVRPVARWYEVPEGQVREAVKFESTLRLAA